MPAATTATRAPLFVPFSALNLDIFTAQQPAILFAFQIEALYTMSPKGENSSSEVRRLSLGVHSAAIRYSKAGKKSWRRFPD
jgi:hypothetical protein